MQVRISSQVVSRSMMIAVAALVASTSCQEALAQAGYYKDPSSGIVYQKVTTTINRPVVEERVESRKQTVYRPQTVTETRPSTRTVYTPVVEYQWEPRVHGRWNPFRKPTVAYHHVPHARWEQHSDVVEQTTTRTEWVAETRNIEVPRKIVRMQTEREENFEPVGQVSPQQATPPGAAPSIASRLRPLASNERVAPIGGSTIIAGSTLSAPQIASSTVGRMTSDPPRRTVSQGGIRTTDLTGQGQVLPPSTGGMTFMR